MRNENKFNEGNARTIEEEGGLEAIEMTGKKWRVKEKRGERKRGRMEETKRAKWRLRENRRETSRRKGERERIR